MVIGVAFVVLICSWWLTGRLCDSRSGLSSVDHPNQRSLHEVPTPGSGGVAILVSVLVGLILETSVKMIPSTIMQQTGFLWNATLLWIIALASLLSGLSFLDDRQGLPVVFRFILHTVAAGLVMVEGGVVLDSVTVPLLGTLQLGWAAVPLTLLFLLWMTNLYNFMDGMDGFAGGMTVFGFAFLAFFAWRARHEFLFVVSLFLAAGAAGFLIFNFPPARIFMGDVGSVPIGFLAGALSLFAVREQVCELWVPLLIFSPFIMDATVTVVRRLLKRERVWEAHRNHYYQRLVLSGWGHRKTVLAEYVLMVLCGFAAWSFQTGTESWRLIILCGWIALFALLALSMHGIERRALGQEVVG